MYPLGVLPCAPSRPLSSFPVVSSRVISPHTHVSAFYPVDFESNSSSNQCPSLGLALSLLAPAPVICSPDQAHDASTDLSCAQGHLVTWTTHASFYKNSAGGKGKQTNKQKQDLKAREHERGVLFIRDKREHGEGATHTHVATRTSRA